MNTCDKKQVWTTDDCFDQEWPQLIVQNLAFEDGYSAVRQTATSFYGGGAIYAKVASSKWSTPGSSATAATRVVRTSAARRSARWPSGAIGPSTSPATRSAVAVFNGGALSSIDVNWDVFNSLMINNRAVGFGANPAQSGTAGGGSGGAIYTDGDNYNVLIAGTVIRRNSA